MAVDTERSDNIEVIPIFGSYLSLIDSKPNQSPVNFFGQSSFDLMTTPKLTLDAPRVSTRGISLGLAGASAILAGLKSRNSQVAARTLPILGSAIAGFALWPHLRSAFRRNQTRLEASREDLLDAQSNPAKQRQLMALEEFRERLAAHEFEVFERKPDGTMRKLSANELRAFQADFGRNLIICSEPDQRELVRSTARPIGELFVKASDAKAVSMFSSITLINGPDEEVFSDRLKWLREQARVAGIDSEGFIRSLELIEGLRHPEVRAVKTAAVCAKLSELNLKIASMSVITKLQSGSYPPFETVVHKLPLKSLPGPRMKRREK